MDDAIARRRVSRILGHVTPIDGELSSPHPHLIPLNCSSTLNSMVPRRDNTMFFARQGSASRSYFMQQASINQNPTIRNFPAESRDSSYWHSASSQYSADPMFSRETQTGCSLPTLKHEPLARRDSLPPSAGAPKFARPRSDMSEKSRFSCNRTDHASLCKGMEWSPRIDVAESGASYVVTVELPGVSIMDIRVEVDDDKLIVMGKRSAQQLGVENGSENVSIKYHRKEILQGPYRVFWPLPNNVNKDMISAEFVNGFLKITLPKL